ncbi:hypothetical protein Lepto7375DRAFT_0034 [Leptolyngbya sp. PCC 7375]|nr:hypothetical protein Lepto7375DRAFT_0034 [Leptolyngbya sp. PCC 7375]
MVSVRQLQLDLGDAFEDAADVPEDANILELWQQFEGVMTELPWRDQLRLGGEVLAQLADICEAKSEILWDDWQDAHNTEGPVLDGDWLKGITRQTQELDFSDLVQHSGYTQRDPFEPVADDESVAGDVDKASVLAFVETLAEESAKEQALAVAHSENVSVWIERLSIKRIGKPQRLIDLQQQVKMPMVEVWIAALLGDFTLEQRGGFYETEHLWIV